MVGSNSRLVSAAQVACSCSRLALQSSSLRDPSAPHEGTVARCARPMHCRAVRSPPGHQRRDPCNLCGRSAEEDDAILDQTGEICAKSVRICESQSHTSHHLIISHWILWHREKSLLCTVRIDSHAQFLLLIFAAPISAPEFEEVHSSCFPAVQARDMQELFRQAKLRTTRSCVDAWKAPSLAPVIPCASTCADGLKASQWST